MSGYYPDSSSLEELDYPVSPTGPTSAHPLFSLMGPQPQLGHCLVVLLDEHLLNTLSKKNILNPVECYASKDMAPKASHSLTIATPT